jgi:hypothetical protein
LNLALFDVDTLAQAADRGVIDLPIEGAAPEAAAEWRGFCDRYQLTVHPIADRKGLTIQARKSRIEFDQKSMHWLWLLSFAGWKAWRLHGPHLFWKWLTSQQIDPVLRSADPTYGEAEADYEAVLYATRDIRDLDSANDIAWPATVPRPQCDKTGFTIEDQAAFDLMTIALAYMLLHEARHVCFYVEKDRPFSAADEELACDAFARDFILAGASQYAVDTSQPIDDIVAKRSAGVTLGAFAIYDLTPVGNRGGSSSYPPIADRLASIYDAVDLPPDNWFWDFAASLLVALVVRNDQRFIIPDFAGHPLCLALIDELRARNQNSIA